MPLSVKVIVFLGISLDGFIAGPAGDLSWLSECANESPAETGYDELMGRTDALVLGRNTYDAVLGFSDWPFGSKRVYVLTHRPMEPAHGETALQGDIEQALRTVQASGARTITSMVGTWCGRLWRKTLWMNWCCLGCPLCWAAVSACLRKA